MNKKLLFVCIVVLILAVAYYFSSSIDYISVISHTITKGEVKASVSNTRVGTVKACRRAYLAPATGGNVARLFVKEGEKVKQQQLLLEVWNDDLKAQLNLRQAEIEVNQATANQTCELAAGAEREAQRLRHIKKSDYIISEDQLDRANTSTKAQGSSC